MRDMTHQKMNRMRSALAIAAIAAGAAAVPAAAAGAAASPKTTATGTEIVVTDGPFGKMLAVGNGKGAGYSVYMITSDDGSRFGCTTTIIKTLPGGPGSCTGAPTDKQAEWPAVLTTGAPIAGTGITKSMLGTVNRAGLGEQVTYDGHPLYYFDQGPGQVTGEGWDEPTLPPWHGVWWLLSPSGSALGWPGTVGAVNIGGKSVLATLMYTGVGWEPFPVYSYSADSSSKSACTASCAVNWPPLLSSGRAATIDGVSNGALGRITLADGTDQLTYHGKPLYLYGDEGIAPLEKGYGYAATGSGNGAKVGSGTFSLVSA